MLYPFFMSYLIFFFLVSINVFDTLPLFKCKQILPVKAHVVVLIMNGWQLMQKAKLLEKKIN